MEHLPLELIVLLETDPKARRLAEELVRTSAEANSAYNKWDLSDNLTASLTDELYRTSAGRKRTELKEAMANAADVRYELYVAWGIANKKNAEARSQWALAFPQWAQIREDSLKDWLDETPTLRTDRPARD